MTARIKDGDKIVATLGENKLKGEVIYVSSSLSVMEISLQNEDTVSLDMDDWTIELDIPPLRDQIIAIPLGVVFTIRGDAWIGIPRVRVTGGYVSINPISGTTQRYSMDDIGSEPGVVSILGTVADS